MQITRSLAVASSLTLLLMACGGSSQTTLGGGGVGGTGTGGSNQAGDTGAGGSGSDQVCTPFETEVCVGPGACSGGRECNAKGTSWSKCDCGSGTGGDTASGGASTGGAASTGGTVSTGGAISTGGVSTGGSVSTGGFSTGGFSTGGVSTGGFSTGGFSTGGVSTGGVSTGGVSTGGFSTGGVSTGGASTGGASTGGVSTGGVSTGGSPSAGACDSIVEWVAGQFGVNYAPGQLFSYQGKTYSYDGSSAMTYVLADCPPVSAPTWCVSQYPYSEVSFCDAVSCANLPTIAEWKAGNGATGDQVVARCTTLQAGCAGRQTGVDYVFECTNSHVPNCKTQTPDSGYAWTYVVECDDRAPVSANDPVDCSSTTPYQVGWEVDNVYATSVCYGGTACSGTTSGLTYRFQCLDIYNCAFNDPGTNTWATPPWKRVGRCQ